MHRLILLRHGKAERTAPGGDIARRQQMGMQKYGTSVEANPLPLRAWLQHAYEETLDQAVYLRRAIEQLDAEGQT